MTYTTEIVIGCVSHNKIVAVYSVIELNRFLNIIQAPSVMAY